MYAIDELDAVQELLVPLMPAGAPLPEVVAYEGFLRLSYLLFEESGRPSQLIVVTFKTPSSHYLSLPNDEALHGHPLSERGLSAYGVFEVLSSSWVRESELRNRVHPQHNPARFPKRRHYIFTFHDSIFECIAAGFEWELGGMRPAAFAA